jgi:DNA-binding PucR family transcriptional regulator
LLLLSDILRAQQFVEAELGPLAKNDSVANRLRETLLAWLATGSVVSAAALLEVHENTIRNRLRQAEDMLGIVIHQRRTELQVALRIARVLRAHEHPDAQFASGLGQSLLMSDGESLWDSSA